MVGVVEKDHVAGPDVARSPRSDALRCRQLAPVLAPARPEQRLEVAVAGGAQAGTAVEPERRAVVAALAYDFDCALQIGFDRGPWESRLDPVAEAVDAHLVAAAIDLGRDVRVALDLLTDEEEDRLDAGVVEGVEHRRCALRVRPVVEGKRRLR